MSVLQKARSLLCLIFIIPGATCAGAIVVSGRYGRSVVLRCGFDPGETFLQITWKIDLYNSSCKASIYNGRVFKLCNAKERMDLNYTSLTIYNIELSDEGVYRCEVVNAYTTFSEDITLKVLAQPSVSLGINSDGLFECRASGGFPPPEISWIPTSNNMHTERFKEANEMWTLISTYRTQNKNMARCLVSHPTLPKPITLTGGSVISVRMGSPVVLHCNLEPEETFTQLSWNNITGSPALLNDCNGPRMNLDKASLTIHRTEISDEGDYTCTDDAANTVIYKVIRLNILALPTVSLDINSAGSPECTAIGGYPAAEISWTPHTEEIITNRFQNDNKTWTVISTYNQKSVNVVTCRISHSTFTSPLEMSITVRGRHSDWKILIFVIFVLINSVFFIYMGIKTKAMCDQKVPETHQQATVIELRPASEDATDSRSSQAETLPEDNYPIQATDLNLELQQYVPQELISDI